MKIVITFFILLAAFFFNNLNAQQLYEQEDLGNMAFLNNPAMTAPLTKATFGISHRQYWRRFKGAPSLCTIYAQYPFEKMSVGVHFIQDKVGGWQQDMLQFSYAYQLRLGGRNAPQLSIGASAGRLWSTFNLMDIKATHLADPLAVSDAHKSTAWLFSGGLYFTSINRRKASHYPEQTYVFAGIAGKYALSAQAFTHLSLLENNQQRVWHGNAILGAYIPNANNYFFIEPMIGMDYTAIKLYSPMAQIRLGFTNSMWVAARYRLQGDVSFQLGLSAEVFKEDLPLQIAFLFIKPSKQQKGNTEMGYGVAVYYQMRR